MLSPNTTNLTALERTEIPPELFLPFRGLTSVPLFFSDYCRKLTTHKGVTITRVIICTTEHIYLCHPNGDILRCFPFTAISRLLHDEGRHQLGIVVPCEFDLAVETPASFQLLHVIDVLRRMHGARTPLDIVRVEPVPRPVGMLGFRADGSIIWDEKAVKRAAAGNSKTMRKRTDQTCMQKALDTCGLQDAWIGFKDGCYRYYRRAMRALDLGIEDDDEVLTNNAGALALQSSAAAAAAASSGAAGGAGGVGGGAGQGDSAVDTMMLAAGKTSFAFGGNSEKSFRGGGGGGVRDSDDDVDDDEVNELDLDGPLDEFGMPISRSGSSRNRSSGDHQQQEGRPMGYRWFRPDKSLEKKRNKARLQQKRNLQRLQRHNNNNNNSQAADTDNEVLNLLLSPMLRTNPGGEEMVDVMMSPTDSASSPSGQSSSTDEWWPGCQVGWPDGPYALTLAKPKGFRVALDQRNSEFA